MSYGHVFHTTVFLSTTFLISGSQLPPVATEAENSDLICDPGWALIERECVTFQYPPSAFDKVLTTCLSITAVLPIAHTEQDWMHRIKQMYQGPLGDQNIWIGLRYKFQNMTFVWTDGAAKTWSDFESDPPSVNMTSTNCVYTTKSNGYKWLVQNCAMNASFVCIAKPRARVTAVLASSTEAVTTTMPDDSIGGSNHTTAKNPFCNAEEDVLLNGNCVPKPSKPTDWISANEACKTDGKTLVMAKTNDQWLRFQSFRFSQQKMSTLDNIWIGLIFKFNQNHFEWADGIVIDLKDMENLPWYGGRPPVAAEFKSDRCAVSSKKDDYMWTVLVCNATAYSGLCYNAPETTTAVTTDPNQKQAIITRAITRPPIDNSTRPNSTNADLDEDKAKKSAKSRSFVPRKMSQAERISSIVVQSMGCTFLIGGLACTLGLFLIFRNFSIEKLIIANQDFALLIAQTLVLTLREPALYPSMSAQLCKCVAILLHYFFMCGYMFMLLEALQMLYIVGHIGTSGSIMPAYLSLAIGWGTPLVIVAVTGPVVGDDYSTEWTCWGDLERRFGWALFFPMVCVCSATVIIVESAGMITRQDPPFDADPVQLLSARISHRGIVIIMGLTLASHIIGIVAVYFQIIYLYVVCFGINVANGIAIFFIHTAVDAKIRRFVLKIWQKARRVVGKQYLLGK